MNRLKLALFDMDGLLIDSERWAIHVFQTAAAELGYDFDREAFVKNMGRKTHPDISEILIGVKAEEKQSVVQAMMDQLNHAAEGAYRTGIPLRPGVMNLLKFLTANHVMCLVASSSSRKKVNSLIAKTAAAPYFQGCVTGEDISRGKPDPEIFLYALKETGAKREETVIFEDSDNGARAALNAGIPYILVPDVAYVSENDTKQSLVTVEQIDQAIPILIKTYQNLQ